VRCTGVGVPKAVRRVGSADNSPPRLGEHRSIGSVSVADAREDVVAIAIEMRQDRVGGLG
jgi:hypothetical protein